MRTIGNGSIARCAEGTAFGKANSMRTLHDWRLATRDEAETVLASGYFNELANEMSLGEAILATVDMGQKARLLLLVVTNKEAGEITTRPFSAGR